VLDAGDRLRCNSEQVLNALIQSGMGRVSFSLDSHRHTLSSSRIP
jgi:hypothetical protein